MSRRVGLWLVGAFGGVGTTITLGLACLATWLLVAVVTRYSSLSALICALAAPLIYLLGDRGPWYAEKPQLALLVAMGALLIYRHRENINKLLKGTESKLGKKS